MVTAGAEGLVVPVPGAMADQVQVVADAKPGIEVLAVRPSWVRVSSADGAVVLFEKILEAGERYQVPAMEQARSRCALAMLDRCTFW